MHRKRQALTKKIPVPRKGTKFVAVASSHKDDSVPVVIAMRDMLKLAKNTKEVKKMIHEKSLKLNGKPIKDTKKSILLFNILEADKPYILSVLPTNKFTLSPYDKKDRPCKVINKKILNKNKTQLNLHDGTNILSQDKINVGDTVYLDEKNKVAKHVPLEKGKSCFIFSGRYVGNEAKVQEVKGKNVKIKLKDKEAVINQSHLMVQ
jgi:small subunit ribosomal protein S4e